MWRKPLERRLAEQRRAGLWRERAVVAARGAGSPSDDDTCLRDFAGNDYLGLARDPRLAEAQAEGARRHGAGGRASHLVSGHLAPHHALEERLAALVGRPRALLFSTGYMANLAVLQVLGEGTTLLQDRLNHASLLDGARLAGARSRRFHHGDLGDLERLLERGNAETPRLIVSDGVFSMDGDVADIAGLAETARGHGACLAIDDAHGIGVLGDHGDGCVGHKHDSTRVPVLTGTLGKALGSAGAFVAGDATLIDAMIQFARPYIYTTAQPPGIACATLRALDILAEEPERRRRLHDHIAYWRQGAAALGLPLMASDTPIQPLLLGDCIRTLRWRDALRRRGFLVGAIRPPTVPRHQARLRITLSAAHERHELDALLETLAELASCDPQEVAS
ncbi:aminotransferase class I/II-fold pyridoxal phosphate-dependent enzyme [Modicisalibacter coralii]|uniref:aminotransferase class I/II-fold pyridoxal phosphate-dependent enzyme n=1 Tax=Modicisalibacter coralii TaxID=2304602 RepID=UPI00100AE923|nr:8-amino-7-oxononanoate synthase [Halomonas coralii]